MPHTEINAFAVGMRTRSLTYGLAPLARKIRATPQRVRVILEGVDEEPAELYVTDFSDVPGAAEYRERLERARTESRRRYRDHLTTVFDLHGTPDPEVLAELALDALTVWRYIDSGKQCRCGCHPRLPETDLHDYGFACVCARTREDRRRTWQEWRNNIKAFWESPEGQQITADEQAAEADLQAWLADQQGVTVDNHGGLIPEEWDGEVDGHNFYFRERHGEWRIELDVRPTGRFVRTLAGTNSDGTLHYGQKELEQGDVIADGTINDDGYGTTPIERAQFIINTIRTHLARQICTLHHDDLSSIEALLGTPITWCPACGTRLPARSPRGSQHPFEAK